jgi:photosystem II stability/assembly factor-like uncharacterized protein
MKKLFFFLVLTFTSFTVINSQTLDWRLLSNSPGTLGGGRYEDIYFLNNSTGWIIAYSGKIYRTNNGGNSWTNTYASGFSNKFRSVGFFDSTTGIIGTLYSDTNLIMYRTTDGGSTIAPVSNVAGVRPKGICGISIVNQTTAYACGRYYIPAGIIKTTDKGITWKVVFNDSSLAKSLIDCYFWSADSGIAVGGYTNDNNYNNGSAVIIKTTNGGMSWDRVLITSRTGEWCWKISFISRNIGFVSIERESGFSYILKTTDNGSNWSEIPFMAYDQEGIGFVNENTGWVGGWTGPTYQTTNGGANWQLAGWGTYVNRFRFLNDSLAYAVGDKAYKYSVGPLGIKNSSDISPVDYSLHQNFPNPFNPETIIKFDIPVNGFTTVKVFDILGTEVSTLVNEDKKAGEYSVHFNGVYLPSGVYFCRLVSNKYSETRRMVLMK